MNARVRIAILWVTFLTVFGSAAERQILVEDSSGQPTPSSAKVESSGDVIVPSAKLGIGTTSAPNSLIELLDSAPTFHMTDSTASAKSFLVKIDANKAFLQEIADIDGGGLTLDLANRRLGVGALSSDSVLDVESTAPTFRMTDSSLGATSLLFKVDANKAFIQEVGDANGDILTFDLGNSRLGIAQSAPSSAFDVGTTAQFNSIKGNNDFKIFGDNTAQPIFFVDAQAASGPFPHAVNVGHDDVGTELAVWGCVDAFDGGIQSLVFEGEPEITNSPVVGFHLTLGTRESPVTDALIPGVDKVLGTLLAQGFDNHFTTPPTQPGLDGIQGTANGGYIAFIVDAPSGHDDMPTRIELGTRKAVSTQPLTRMTIKNDGDIGIGTATPSARLHVLTEEQVIARFASTETRATVDINNARPNADGDPEIRYLIDTTPVWGVGVDDSDGDKFKFSRVALGTNDTLVMDTSGNVAVGTNAWGSSATKVLAIKKGTTPPSNSPSDTAQLWVEQVGSIDELRVMDDGGNVTTLSTHNRSLLPGEDLSVAHPWTLYTKNAYLGVEQNVDMAGVVRAVEQLSGQQFIFSQELPTEQKRDWHADQMAERERVEAERLAAALEEEVEIALADAIELVEIMEMVPVMGTEIRYRIDLESEEVVPELFSVVTESEEVGTGEFRKELKEGVRFDEATGKLYRNKTVTEITIEPYEIINPSAWMLSRMQ